MASALSFRNSTHAYLTQLKAAGDLNKMGKFLSSGAFAGRTDLKILPEGCIPLINWKSSGSMTQGKQTWAGIWKGGVILSVLALLNKVRRGGARIAHSGLNTQPVQMP